MRNIFVFFILIFSISVNARNCIGHIFFYNLDEGIGEADAASDYAFYYHIAKKWLPKEGVSTSVHTELPVTSNTCFGQSISIEASTLDHSLGYVFVQPNLQQKVIGGVLTDMDISNIVNDFLKSTHNKVQLMHNYVVPDGQTATRFDSPSARR